MQSMMGSGNAPGPVTESLDNLYLLAKALADPAKLDAIRAEIKAAEDAANQAADDAEAKIAALASKEKEIENRQAQLDNYAIELTKRDADLVVSEEANNKWNRQLQATDDELQAERKALEGEKDRLANERIQLHSQLTLREDQIQLREANASAGLDARAKALKEAEDALTAREAAIAAREAELAKQAELAAAFAKSVAS